MREAEPRPERDRADERTFEDLEVTEEDAEEVQGGLRAPSPPSGPTPVPYPNTNS
jgi:hypothetical protein